MASAFEWRFARQLANLVAAPGGGLRREEAASALGIDYEVFRSVVMLAYSRRWVDFCGQFVVAPCWKARPRR
jgi:hypothetical protein